MDGIGFVGNQSVVSGNAKRATEKEKEVVNNALNKKDKEYPTAKEALSSGKDKTDVIDFGNVYKVLPQDNQGNRHQLFLIKTDEGKNLKVAHNLELADAVSDLKPGMRLGIKGECIPSKLLQEKTPEQIKAMGLDFEFLSSISRGDNVDGILHWTHHVPQGSKHDNGGIVVLSQGPHYGKIFD